MVLTVLKGLGKAYLKSKAKTIKSVAPTVSKELSQKAKAWRVRGFFDRMQSKLKTEEQEKFTKAYKKWKKKK